ncbi:hypothetical protein [Mycobacteroides abscessus]|uniref:hypothetical protein n=1 Tax=Mycobacteroides abscessus TaxID=36809 RepID=UPI00036109E7|nr:hypothetical protein [Mycobacteroides abscessus]MBL3735259.1 hypothetical protein [Mycobacteroides abscessus subsp. massiliense]MBL3744975.1 hypothetical protein [Mycobacteroides abscessus subsp. massiliense]MBL3761289.1 hypothetical protein [Mycobacteroides abscessus subsp. massiliense]MBN7482431.1 hypothetical protein [Mycobacteroides abscessus subsp. massiliense]MDB2213652.1 hypothetical protein [Mycobacteroides abscessus subsp. massiliense]
MAVVSAWRRVRAALTELNKCAWLPEPTAVTGRPLQREKPADPTRSPHFGGPPPLTDATCHDGPLLRRTD